MERLLDYVRGRVTFDSDCLPLYSQLNWNSFMTQSESIHGVTHNVGTIECVGCTLLSKRSALKLPIQGSKVCYRTHTAVTLTYVKY